MSTGNFKGQKNIRRYGIATSVVALLALFIFPVCAASAYEVVTNKSDLERPYDAEALRRYNRAVQLHQAGALKKAIDEYLFAVKADERMVEAWCNLGGIYIVRHEYTKALDAFDKALAFSPNSTNNRMILNGSGSALIGLGRYDDAIEKFKDVLKIDPSFSAAAENLKRAEQLQEERKK